jgi:hypothetical protein
MNANQSIVSPMTHKMAQKPQTQINSQPLEVQWLQVPLTLPLKTLQYAQRVYL